MRLWTLQPYRVYELIQNEGVYRCDINKSSFVEMEEFMNAYEWIINQMKKRIGNPPKGVKYPVWAWYLYKGKNKRPSTRRSGLKVTEKSVLLEIEIPASEVLLTDFCNWHCLLNDCACYYATSDEDFEKEDEFYESLSEEEQRLYKIRSWEQIICTPEVSLNRVQATFWELKASQIKNVWILNK